jgi:hypothetical protein
MAHGIVTRPRRRLVYLAEDVVAIRNRGTNGNDNVPLKAGTPVLELETFSARNGNYTDFRCGRYWYRVMGNVKVSSIPPTSNAET